jgi:hypothetical protein
VKTILSFLFAFALVLVFSIQAHSEQLLWHPTHANFIPPKALSLCGEQMPLEKRAVWEMLDREFTLAVHNHAQVLMWLKRAGRYFSYFEKKLDEAGMPDDLKYLAVAESSLRPNIRSRKGALGLWQFIPKTARRYKLKRNRSMDERRNLESSTEAALKYLKELRGIFNSWALAMAAYNCGEDRLQKEIKEQKINDYYSLNLPRETERFIFRIAAIKLIMENPERYGYSLSPESIYKPRQFDSVHIQVEKPVHITGFAKAIQTDLKVIKELNPKINGYYLPVGQYMLKIPTGKKKMTAKALHQLDQENASRTEKRDSPNYRVQPGETLSHISQHTGISVAELKRLNNIKGSLIMVGQELQLEP